LSGLGSGDIGRRGQVQVQLLAREVNQRTRELLWVADDVPCEFVCECGRSRCSEVIALTTSEYDTIRAQGARVLLRRGHDHTEEDEVVDCGREWVVIEKRGTGRAVALWHSA